MFSSRRAVLLAGSCRQTYRQIDSGTVTMPTDYRFVLAVDRLDFKMGVCCATMTWRIISPLCAG